MEGQIEVSNCLALMVYPPVQLYHKQDFGILFPDFVLIQGNLIILLYTGLFHILGDPTVQCAHRAMLLNKKRLATPNEYFKDLQWFRRLRRRLLFLEIVLNT